MRAMFLTERAEAEVEEDAKPGLLTCAQWVAKYGWPSMGGLRWIIFRAKNDPELRRTFIRVHRRVLLKEREFLDYLEMINKRDLQGEVKNDRL